MSKKTEEEVVIAEPKTKSTMPEGYVEGKDGEPVKLRDAGLQPVTSQEVIDTVEN